jgi:hypothetical protein
MHNSHCKKACGQEKVYFSKSVKKPNADKYSSDILIINLINVIIQQKKRKAAIKIQSFWLIMPYVYSIIPRTDIKPNALQSKYDINIIYLG